MGHSSQALFPCKWEDWTVAGRSGSHRNDLVAAAGPLRNLESITPKAVIKLPELLIGTDLFTCKPAQKERLPRCLRE